MKNSVEKQAYVWKLFGNAKNKLKVRRFVKQELPKEIWALTNLHYLDLRHCHLNKLPPDILNLKNLEILNISHNRFVNIPEVVLRMTSLKKLIIEENQLIRLSPSIKNLIKLEYLSLYGNHLRKLPPQIKENKNLQKINLGNNSFKRFPEALLELNNLEEIWIQWNFLKKLPLDLVIKLPKLKKLHLKGNSSLDKTYHSVGYEYTWSWKELKAVLFQYRLDKIQGKKTNDYKAKIVFIGDGRVGKTSLMKALLNEEFNKNEKSTHGIKIKHNNYPINEGKNELLLNFWDFGGQEIQFNLHHLFLTEEAIYILVWDGQTEGDKYGYLTRWLAIINSIDNNSPIIIVKTKIDEIETDKSPETISTSFFLDKYPNIKELITVSAKKRLKIKELHELIVTFALKLPVVNYQIPSNFVAITEELIFDTRSNQLSFEDYVDVCSKYNVNKSGAKILCSRLHKLGIVLFYENDNILRSKVYLRPEYITNMLYKILAFPKIRENNGYFNFEDVNQASEEITLSNQSEFIHLLQVFDLCFEIIEKSNQKAYLAPVHLDDNKPNNITWEDETKDISFLFDFEDFIPFGLIFKLIQEFYSVEENVFSCWKHGFFLKENKRHTLLIENKVEKTIYLFIKGEEKITLLNNIKNIINTFSKNNYSEYIFCSCKDCLTKKINDRTKFKYVNLLSKIKLGQYWEFCEIGTPKKVKISDIQGVIEIGGDIKKALMQIDENTKNTYSEVLTIKNQVSNIQLKFKNIATKSDLTNAFKEIKTITLSSKKAVNDGFEILLDSILENRKEDIEPYKKVENWLPHYENLESTGKNLSNLAVAEYLYNNFCPDAIDSEIFAPCVFQYARVIETELMYQIFVPFKTYIETTYTMNQQENLLKMADTGISHMGLKNQPKSLLVGIQSYFMFNLMIESLDTLNQENTDKIELFKVFRSFLKNKIDLTFLLDKDKSIGVLKQVKEIRNRAGHSYGDTITENEAKRIINLIKVFLQAWTTNIK